MTTLTYRHPKLDIPVRYAPPFNLNDGDSYEPKLYRCIDAGTEFPFRCLYQEVTRNRHNGTAFWMNGNHSVGAVIFACPQQVGWQGEWRMVTCTPMT